MRVGSTKAAVPSDLELTAVFAPAAFQLVTVIGAISPDG